MSDAQRPRYDLKERLFAFAVSIVKLVRGLPNEVAAREIGRQLIRAGTSIAANYEEALGSFSKKEFTYKLSTSFRESKEANLWLRLLERMEIIGVDHHQPILKESQEIGNILGKGVSTARKSL